MKYGEDYCVVREGDTLESIAEKYLGDSSLAPLLRQINYISPDGIAPGNHILLHPIGLDRE